MVKRFFIIGYVLFYFCNIAYSNQIDSLLLVLDNEISQSEKYTTDREMRIESLKKLYYTSRSQPEQSYLIISKLYEDYRGFNFDSALYFLDLKIDISKKLIQPEPFWESRLQLADILSATGMYKEAQDVLIQVNRKMLPPSLLSKYYNSQWLLNDQIWHSTRESNNVPNYKKLTFAFKDSLLNVLDKHSFDYKKAREMQLYESGDVVGSREIIADILEGMQQGTAEYALFAYRMAMTYRSEKNREQEKKYLILSALSDIRYAIKDNASLTLLAMHLYEEKKINKAYDYIQFSLADAVFFNAPLRFVEMARILPVINEAYQLKSEKQKKLLQSYLFVISFLAVFLISSLIFIFMQMRKLSNARIELENANQQLNSLNENLSSMNRRLNELNQTLSESDHVKELYIGHFLSRCSSYIDKLESYQKMVNKFIAAKKINELFNNTKSSQLIEKELEEFYANFDTTFLTIYPDFVSQLNLLLNEDDRIVIKNGELLNTELRIFALIRLGITDSSKIASLLRYSVNTIYNYRVKIKNKASVPRDDFEERVMKIGTFSK
jgi:hypothetical protein